MMWHRLGIVALWGLTSISAQAEQSWFTDTPMREAYQALLVEQPTLAWQELMFALTQAPVDESHWATLKHAIINQTDCGQRLTEPNGKGIPHGLTISFVRRAGASSLGYEIKLSAEQVANTTRVTLMDPSGQMVLSATLTAQASYQEIESGQLFTQVDPGVYELKLGNQHYSLVIYGLPRRPWVQLTGHPDMQLAIDLPTTPQNCAPATAYWLWLDDAYRWVDQAPIYASGRTAEGALPVKVDLPTSPPATASHLSATVSHFEYQGAIKVSYVERLALPLPNAVERTDAVNSE
ncbi:MULTISPECIES: DUF2861 family protein [unclassified Salinivibrio]|uniref:DUF2861 family protein n=1 Tax=unclassified Salinivibrio TaxID=2636825 RepID=UPI000A01BFBE|nr:MULTISPECIES: DUF2861 family protein [unclassified Salinivibrio]PCE69268.1 hypothetical protein B6G00_13845 [Salinivibrio sp. YCSC6]QCF36306.1 DUF2861 family protein [Salinivibrio sp. YCSC6]